MIVYGDHGREESIPRMVESLRGVLARVRASSASRAGVDCDALRGVLIQAGELEQAVFDAPSSLGPRGEARAILRSFRAATSMAASAFHAACIAPRGGANAAARVRRALGRMQRALGRIPEGGDPGRVWVKVPDGFSFHALFPERYREAALRWVDEHPDAVGSEVLVVGIRSIGTTLSAVVQAALRARGVRARRITVRPKGRPPERRLRLGAIRPAAWALIVDEGPGLTGSSVPAVANALERAGIERIHVFPGHEDGPGIEARDEAKAHWKRLPTYCSTLAKARLGDGDLSGALWNSAASKEPLARIVACGEGAWRSMHYEDKDAWPTVCRGLERPKFLCEGESGRKLLFKFAGLATAPGTSLSLASVHARKLARLAERGFTPSPVATTHGFVATEWIQGRPLRASDASPERLSRLGRYVAAASGPPLSVAAARAARNRLETMLAVNTREALGDDSADVALSLFRPIAILEGMSRCGDGHMAPHEWIGCPEGPIQKTDAGGHDLDPTWTGRQPVLWDLAGASLEWDLCPSEQQTLLDGFAAGGGGCCAPLALDAYMAAYAAHRAGQVRFARDIDKDPRERARLDLEYERWRGKLAGCLSAISSH